MFYIAYRLLIEFSFLDTPTKVLSGELAWF
jgi:hypothetical protein